MRKMLKDKKGFTLVELMIVVVIMGILVAVAVPVYTSVTKNAKTKTCATNIKSIQSTINQYQMSGAGGDEMPWSSVATDVGSGYDKMPAAFTNLFTDGVPVCPQVNKDKTTKPPYTITVTPNANDAEAPATISVQCVSDVDGIATAHNAAAANKD